MTQRTVANPPLRLHKHTGQMYVNLNGHRHYLGKAGSPGIDEAYHRLLSRWKAGGQQPLVNPDDITVVEVVARFRKHAVIYYTRREVANWAPVLRELKRLFGTTSAATFDAPALRAVRHAFIDTDCCRSYVNAQATRIRRVFRWAVSEGLVDGNVLHGLLALEGLKKGRTMVRETEPVHPVPVAHLDAVRRNVNATVRAMIDMQLLTAARPGEVMSMRAVDIDTSRPVWIYTPAEHKNAHRGTRREVYVGPKAQRVLQPLMAGRPVDAYLFPPAADPRVSYSRSAYRQAIHRACDRGNVPRWSPGQLRHNAASRLREEFGLEAAQVLLGHARADVTQVYAEVNHAKALEVALKIG